MWSEPLSTKVCQQGGGTFRGRKKGGGFGFIRGQLIFYNCGQPQFYSRDCANPMSMCSYCKVFDHII